MNEHRIGSIARGAARVALMLSIAQVAGMAAAESITLDYSTQTGLPDTTGQGLAYYNSAAATESNTFSVANNALHINTSQYGGDVAAYYQANNAYNSSESAELIVTARVTAANGIGLGFTFYDTSYATGLFVTQTGWSIYNTGSHGTVSGPASAYHTYDLVTSGPTHTFTLSIDGTVVATGNQIAGYAGTPAFWFGDGTTSGGNVTGDISYLSFNNPAAVPEPASPTLLVLGLLGSAGWARRRPSPRGGGE